MNNMFAGMPFGGMWGNMQAPAGQKEVPGNMPPQSGMPAFPAMQPDPMRIMLGMWIAYAKMWEFCGRQCENYGKKLRQMLEEQAKKMQQQPAAPQEAGKADIPAFPGMTGLPKDLDLKKLMALAKVLFRGSDIDYDYEE